MVLIKGRTILDVSAGAAVPDGVRVTDMGSATLLPGLAPPPEVMARVLAIIANTRRLYEAGAVMVAGTDAGIAPIKAHDVVRYSPPC